MKCALVLAVVVVSLLLPGLAVAVGPFDGAYSIVETSTNGQFMDYGVVLQNGAQVVVSIMHPDEGSWFYGVGTLSGNTASGMLFQANGTSFGNFNLTVGSDGSLSGTLTDPTLTISLTGSRIF